MSLTPRAGAATLLLAFAVGGAACGFGRAQVPADVRALAATSVALDVRWRVQVNDQEVLAPDPFERGGVAVDASGSMVVATTSTGHVIGVAAEGGTVRWRVDTGGEPFAAAPTIADGAVFVAVPDGTVRALHLDSGGEIWRRDVGDVFHSAPTVTPEAVLVNSATGHVHALARDTGRVLWSVDRRGSAELTVSGGGQPTVVDGLTIAGFPDGSLAAIDAEGDLVWLTNLANGETRLMDVDTTPLVVDGAVYAGSFSGGMFRIELDSGVITWRSDVRGATHPLWVDGRIVTATADGTVVWLDPADGAVVAELGMDGDASGVLSHWGRYVLLAEPHDGLYVLEGARPWIHARFHPDTGFSGAAVAAGSRLFALTDGGFLYGIETVVVGSPL